VSSSCHLSEFHVAYFRHFNKSEKSVFFKDTMPCSLVVPDDSAPYYNRSETSVPAMKVLATIKTKLSSIYGKFAMSNGVAGSV
jgi:hypothetical protein